MKGGAWLVLAVSALMGLGLTIGAIASRRHMSTAVVVVLCLVGIAYADIKPVVYFMIVRIDGDIRVFGAGRCLGGIGDCSPGTESGRSHLHQIVTRDIDKERRLHCL